MRPMILSELNVENQQKMITSCSFLTYIIRRRKSSFLHNCISKREFGVVVLLLSQRVCGAYFLGQQAESIFGAAAESNDKRTLTI